MQHQPLIHSYKLAYMGGSEHVNLLHFLLVLCANPYTFWVRCINQGMSLQHRHHATT